MHPHRRNTERSKKEERIPDITTTTTEQAIQKLAKGKEYHIVDDDGVGFV
jgi:hypothetical protein